MDASKLLYNLTDREMEVAHLACKSDKEIGLELGITVATVKTHLSNIRSKMGLQSKFEIAYMIELIVRLDDYGGNASVSLESDPGLGLVYKLAVAFVKAYDQVIGSSASSL
jgi:DNA-binding CsgD family transcriptional regulator